MTVIFFKKKSVQFSCSVNLAQKADPLLCVCVRVCVCVCPAISSESSIFMKGESVKAAKFIDFTCLFYEGLSGGPVISNTTVCGTTSW